MTFYTLPVTIPIAFMVTVMCVLQVRLAHVGRPTARFRWMYLWWCASWVASGAMFASTGEYVSAALVWYSSAACFWLWWKSGGGDDTRRLFSRITATVRIRASRLVAVAVPVAR